MIPPLMKHWISAFQTTRPFTAVANLPRYVRQLREYRRMDGRTYVRLRDSYPCLLDAVARTPFDPHYFHQGAWLARRLTARSPATHVDVGSSVLTMGVLSGMVPTVFLDYRPIRVSLTGFYPVAGSITRLPFRNGVLDSVSSLHVLEHIGLGRYGDPLDADGSRRGALELERVTQPGGYIYVSVPIGRERVCFNAHRVFAPETVVSWFGASDLVEFSFVDDAGEFQENRPVSGNQALEYGCGLFIFEKRA